VRPPNPPLQHRYPVAHEREIHSSSSSTQSWLTRWEDDGGTVGRHGHLPPSASRERPTEASHTPNASTTGASMRRLMFFLILSVAPGSAWAQGQGATVDVPANASARTNLSGWVCDRGYHESNGACTLVNVPANAHLTGGMYGRGWDCERGFRLVDESCVAVAVPEDAYLDSSGEGWKCNRGYLRVNAVDATCHAIQVPANAFLNALGDGWVCDRGHREVAESCVAVRVPANGYATNTTYGAAWNCERGYRPVGEFCEAVAVPANGYLTDSSYGPGWQCERGYRQADASCVAVVLPEHAHLDYSGNSWDCDRPYYKQEDRCALPATQSATQ